MSAVDVDRLVADRYRVTAALHRGGGVETLLANDEETSRPVVLKVTAHDDLSDHARRRLEHEGVVLGRMDHPNVAQLLDRGRDGAIFYLVTPWVPGRSLAARLAGGALSVRETLLVARDVVAAVAHAHDHGVLHRDIKPSNIVVSGDPLERAVLVDFGLARSELLDADVRDVPVGSVRYLAPEQAGLLHAPVDERSDLYSVGLSIAECLRGAPVFEGRSVGDVLRQQMTAGPPAFGSGVPSVLGHIIDRTLRRDPAERYQSAHALLHDLDRLTEGLDAAVADPTFPVGTTDRRETLAEPTFIGRAAELDVLERHLETAASGHGGVVLVGAESGGGKSRMLEELTRRVRGRARTFHGQGLDQAAVRPFQMLSGLARDIVQTPEIADELAGKLGPEADVVATALPELAPVLGVSGPVALGPEEFGEVRTVRALATLLDSLGTPERPALIVLDDCQWADESSARLLVHWVEHRCSPCHALVVLAYRSDELAVESPLRRLDAQGRIALPPLSAEDIAVLARSMAGSVPEPAVEVVVRLADGSPFMAAAVLRGLVESGALTSGPDGWEADPDALADARSSRQAGAVLAHRIQLLEDVTRRLLAVGAVLGKEFEVDVAAALAEVGPLQISRAVREASRRHLVWADGGRCRFVHDKVRETLLDQLGDDVRRELHLRTATLLELREPTRFFDLAFHFDAAGEAERALPYALAAADEARAQQSLEAAEQQYRIAERAARDATPAIRAWIAEELGRVLMLRGRYEEAAAQLDLARELGGEPLALARIDGTLGELAFKRGDMASSAEALERAVRTLGERMPTRGWLLWTLWEVVVQVAHCLRPGSTGRRALDDPRAERDLLVARLYSRLAHTFWFQRGSVATAFVHLRGMNTAERYEPSPQLAQAWSEHAPVMGLLPWYSRGVAYAQRSFAIRRDLGDLWGQGQSLHFHGVVLYAASRWDECLERCREAIRLLDRTGDRWEVNTARWHIAYASYRLGDLATAARIGEDVWRAGAELGDPQARGIGLAVWSKATDGRIPDSAIEAELHQLADDVHTAAEVLTADALRRLHAGDPDAAVDQLLRADTMVRAAGLRQEYVAPVPAWLLTALRAQRDQHSPHLDLRARRRDLRHARRIARRARRLGRLYRNNQPHALREAALVEAALGRRRRARRWLDRSLAVAEELGAREEAWRTLVARHEVGSALGWPTASADLAAARRLDADLHAAAGGDDEPDDAITVSLADRFESLLASGRDIASSLSAVSVFSALAEAGRSLLRPQDCLVLASPDLDRQATAARLEVVAGSGEPPSETLVDRTLGAQQPIVMGELLDADASDSMLLSGVRSLLCAPISIRGGTVGCLYVSHRDLGGVFGDDEVRIAGFLAALAGSALENAESFSEVQALTHLLEDRVVERTAALSEANARLDSHISELGRAYEREQQITEQLRRLDQFKTELMAITAHDLRTPLTIIAGFASTLHDRGDRIDDDRRRLLLHRIVTNTRRLSEFAENLLQFTRIESGELRIESEPFDLGALVERTVAEFAEAEPDRHLRADVEEGLPRVVGDESRQWQVLVNLLSNAVKYSPPGTPVVVEVARRDREIVVSVRDRGAGIPAADLHRLFGKFVRVGSGGDPGEKKAMGTGLGLYICRSLVEAHGGTIRADSVVGRGTTFTYTVPLDLRPAEEGGE